MNRKLELILYIIIFSLFGFLFVENRPNLTAHFHYSVALWIGFGAMLAISRYIVSPGISNKKFGQAAIYLIAGFIICFFITASFFRNYILEETDITAISYFEPLVLQEITPFLLIATIIGLINLINVKSSLTKKVFYFIAGAAGLAILAFSVKYLIDVQYDGGESIKFIEGNPQTLNEVVNQAQFKDKVVYIDLWYSSCSPCITEFGHLPGIKKALSNENVEYLYMARKTSHPNHLQRWKNAIKKYNLEGWHIYMSPELEEDVWTSIESNTEKGIRGYPRYLIVDRSNVIISYSADQPSDGELLIDKLRSLSMK